MKKLVVLKLDGDLSQGVRVTLEIGEEDSRPATEITAQLPPASDLVTVIDQWHSTYRSLGKSSRLEAKKIVYGGSIIQWREDCDKSAVDLRSRLNNWLLSESFRPIREKWLQQLSPSDEVRVLIRASSMQLRKLPWHLWDLIEDYPNTEVAYSAPESELRTLSKTPTYRDKVRILAILGNSTGINVQKDRQLLENLPDAATTFLVEPQRQDINDQLWNQSWDILFFAGHSKTEGNTGQIFINQNDYLTIGELKYALSNAVKNGLQLAIFNSCDGLGLALDLQHLQIGQIIVMREPVPDQVAQAFLTYFLAAFAGGKSFYLAEREARLKLQGLEDKFPCASWLPAIFQNPAVVSPSWQDLGRRPTEVCPYRGLFAFREEDAPFFKGREAFTEILVEAVQKQPLVAVIGSSGSGKSSVVFAGLIPQLRSESKWRIVSFRPSDRPLHALAAALLTQLEPQMSRTDRLREVRKLAADLRSEDEALRDVVDDIVGEDDTRLLLVADQFEELYTLCRDAQERQAFLDRLLEAANSSLKFTLVITLRADFLGQALSYRPFADALQYADLKLGSMNYEELQAAVEHPAMRLGVTIESGLTQRILEAVSTQAGDLPLLEFALHQLWAKQLDAQLTHAAYEEIGGVEAALARYAEEAYGSLNEEEKERARRLFIQLVRPGEGTEDTRRLATRAEVGEENWDLVTRLASVRLVVSSRDETAGEETVEIVHEALIGGWERLRLWIELDRAFRTWQERLRVSLHQWKASGKDEGALLRGVPLAEAEGWLQARPVELSPAERSFIEQGAKARNRQRRRLVFGLNVGLVGALTLTGMVGWQWQRAEKQRQLALAGKLAAQASLTKQQFESQPTEALLSAMRAAYELKKLTGKGTQAKYLMTEPILALQSILDKIRAQKYSGGDRTILQFTPSGDRVLSLLGYVSSDHTIVTLLDSRGNQLAKFKSPGLPETAQLSPDGQRIVTTTRDGMARLWDLQGNQLAAFKGHQGMVKVVQFSPDGRRIVTGDDSTARLWDLQGNQLTVFREGEGPIFDVQFSPKSDRLLILRGNGSGGSDNVRIAQLWDLQGNQLTAFGGHQGELRTVWVEAVQFSPDGKRIVTGGQDNTARLWDVQGKQLAVFKGHSGGIKAVQFSPDGKHIITGGIDRTARLWDLQGKQLALFKGHEAAVTAVQFSPDGQRIATGGSTGTGRAGGVGRNGVVRLWNLQGDRLATFWNQTAVETIHFSLDGQRIATGGSPGTGRAGGVGIDVFEISFGWFGTDGQHTVTSDRGTTHIWHLQQGNQLVTFTGQQGKVKTVQFSPDGKYIATLAEDGTVRLWNRQGKQLATFKRPQGDIEQVRFSPKGDRVFTVEQNGIIQVWNLEGKPLTVLKGKWGSNWKNPISPDGKYAVTGAEGNSIQISDLAGNRIALSPQIPGAIHALQFSPKGDSIAIAGGHGMVHLWYFWSKELVVFKAHPSWVNDVYFTPDGERIITITSEGPAQLWDLKGNKLATIKKRAEFSLEPPRYGAGSDTLQLSVFSPKSGRFITTIGDDMAFLWDLKGKQLAALQGNQGWFEQTKLESNPDAVQISSDGDRIATVGADDLVRVWDSKGQQIAEHEGYAMTLSPDGKKIVVVSRADNIPRMWRVDNLDGLLKRGCDWLRGYLALGNGNNSDHQICGINKARIDL